MGFKTGLVFGLGIGFVLGSRAGERRYEQLRSTLSRVSESPSVQRVSEKARGLATESTRRGMDAVQEQLDKAGAVVRDRLHRDEGSSDVIVDLTEGASDVAVAASNAADRATEGLSDAVPEVPRTP